MALDRDLGVAVVRACAGLGIPLESGWEATAATGVRGLRLTSEAGGFGSFRFTEAIPVAYEVLRANLADRPTLMAELADGRRVPEGAPFAYVDLDPFGTPVPFVPSALQATAPDGILAVTATDMVVLAGAQASATARRYGARPVRGRLGPEGGLRILLAYVAREARNLGRTIRPLLAYAIGHHVRAYLRVEDADSPPDPVGTVDPSAWDGPPLGGPGPIGPLWLGPIVDPSLADRLAVPPTAEHAHELDGLLARFREEARVPVPFYYEPNQLAAVLGLASPPSLASLSARLRAGGYRVARTHARPEGLRTDAPRATVEAAARDATEHR